MNNDAIMQQQLGASMVGAAGPSGSMDLVNPAVGNAVRKFFGGGSRRGPQKLGTDRSTAELLDEGFKAKEPGLESLDPETMSAAFDALDKGGDNLPAAPDPDGQPPSPLEPVPGLGTAEEEAAKMRDVAKQGDLERRTWERNVNLDYIQDPEELGSVLEVNARHIGEVAHEGLGEIEADVDGNVKEIMQDVLTNPPSGNLNSRQLLAGRRMLVSMVDQVNRLKDKILDDTATTEDKLNFEKLQGQAVMLQKYMQGQVRETARALNSMKIVANTLNSRDLEAMSRMASDASVVTKAKIMAERQAEDPRAALESFEEMTWLGRSTASLINYWTASILSGFKTQVVNVASNQSMRVVNGYAVRPLAAAVSPLRRKLTGDTEGVEFAEVGAQYIAARDGLRDALLMAGRVFTKGTFQNKGEYVSSFGNKKIDDITQDTLSLAGALGVDKVPVLSHLLNFVQRSTEAASYGLLSMGDEYFKAMAYRSSLYGQSVRQAASEGLQGDALTDRANELLNNVTKRMHDEALAEAERMTFTNETNGALGSIANKFAAFAQEEPLFKFIVPFIRTPTALLDRTIKMSPIAWVQKDFRERVAKGGADADVAIGEMLFGSTMLVLFYALYQEEVITGAGPENYAQREALERLGWQPYSIKIGNKYISYKRGFDPLGMSIGAVMTMLDRMAYKQQDPSAGDWTLGAALALAKYFSDQPYLTGIANIMALVDGKKDPDAWSARQLASFVPSLWRDAESARRGLSGEETTPVVYQGREFWSMLNDYLEQRIPGNMGDDLPPLRYWDGTVVTAGGGNALYLYNSLSPIKVSIGREDVASERMAANGVKVTPPVPVVTVWSGARIKVDLLNDLENGEKLYDKLLQLVGESRRKRLDTLVKNRTFQKLESGPNSDQSIEIERQLQQGLSDGKKLFLQWLIDEKPSVEEYGQAAILLDARGVKQMLRQMQRGTLSPKETEILQDAGTKGMATRGELYVPDI